jgi:hypothetical protein
MCKYGKPKESNTEVGEKNHKVFAKRIGRRCRKQHKTFAKQVAQRLSDSFVIDKMASAMGLFADENDDDGESTVIAANNEANQGISSGATHCSLSLLGENVEVVWQSSTEKHLLTWDPSVATFIKNNYMVPQNTSTIHCCTEYKHNNILIRCHPSYQGEGPWFDWVSASFEQCTIEKKKFPKGDYACKVLAILPHERNPFLSETELIVKCAGSKTKKDSALFEEWTLVDGHFSVSVTALLKSIFVLEMQDKKIAVALSYSEWPSCFTDMSSY